jgi:hypothetical protein
MSAAAAQYDETSEVVCTGSKPDGTPCGNRQRRYKMSRKRSPVVLTDLRDCPVCGLNAWSDAT